MTPDIDPVTVMSLPGLFVLTAIPVVAFALWCTYFEGFVARLKEEGERLDRAEEITQVRSANFLVILFQVAIFLSTWSFRKEHPFFAYPLFLGAMTGHLWLQSALESKIREKSSTGFFKRAARGFFWSAVAGLAYLAVLLGSVFAFSALANVLKASEPVALSLVIAGLVLGVLGGLGLTFGMSPFFVRKIFKSERLEEGHLLSTFQEDFARAGLIAPVVWTIEIEQFHSGTAMVAGFRGGRGLFRPALFLTRSAIEGLNYDEIRSVVLHEISHMRLEHQKRRMLFSAGLVICASLVTGLLVLIAGHLSPPGSSMQGVVGSFSIVFCFGAAFKMLSDQSRFQEINADIHAIDHLGGKLEHLASALRKLDRLNDELPFKNGMSNYLMSMGHPATERRIRLLEIYFEKKRAVTDPAASDTAA